MEGTVEILENWVEESFLVQQDELALLNSMYSAAELRFISGFSLEEFSRIIESRIFNGVSDLSEAQVLMPHFNTVEFSLKIPIIPGGSDALEVNFEFPIGYPKRKNLYFFLRCEFLKCSQLEELSHGGHDFLQTLPPGDPQVVAVVDWLRDNLVQLLNRQLSSDESSQRLEKDDRRNSSRFVRWWIHSHHIVGKAKRQTLPVLADQYDLTGFLLPGKPGVICVEGAEEDVKEFWERIRTWAWKKIGVRHMEDCSTSNSARKFGKLREQSQMDMTAFKRFLDDHNCVEVFPVLFGLSDLIDG